MSNRKTNKFAKFALQFLGFSLCIVPPLICTASYFPIWKESTQALSGGALLLLLISSIPIYKLIKRKLSSPASYIIWLVLFVVFFTLSSIAEQMTVISFFGFVGNLLGAICFKIAKRGVNNEQ